MKTWVRDTTWVREARCAKPEYVSVNFFPRSGESGNEAKAICAECPVRKECLEHALTNHVSGIWGGMTARERDRLRRVL